jgi:hypothetical protein
VPATVATALGSASAALTQAQDHLARWRSTDRTGGRVRAGYAALSAIDATMAALHEARAALVAELHTETIDRADRIDDMLARLTAAHADDGFDYQREIADGDGLGGDPGQLPPGVHRHLGGRGGRLVRELHAAHDDRQAAVLELEMPVMRYGESPAIVNASAPGAADIRAPRSMVPFVGTVLDVRQALQRRDALIPATRPIVIAATTTRHAPANANPLN